MAALDLGALRFSVRARASPLVVGGLVLLLAVVLAASAKQLSKGELGSGLVALVFAAPCVWGIRRSAVTGRTTLTLFDRGVTLAPAWRAGTGPLSIMAWRDVRAVATRQIAADGNHRELTAAEAAEEAPRRGLALLHRNGGMMRIPGELFADSPGACAELLAQAFETVTGSRAV